MGGAGGEERGEAGVDGWGLLMVVVGGNGLGLPGGMEVVGDDGVDWAPDSFIQGRR